MRALHKRGGQLETATKQTKHLLTTIVQACLRFTPVRKQLLKSTYFT